jgi:chemotaxis receptor (MCP) glutamine deamidase CheD
MELKLTNQIVPPAERYCFPRPNEIKFISNKQTLSLALGSCISTVFIGRNDKYILAANHIVIANPYDKSIIATKSAREQIEEILQIYEELYNIKSNDIRCFHIVGGGSKNIDSSFKVHIDNIIVSKKILKEKGFDIMFEDTKSYCIADYSLYKNNLSVFIENSIIKSHITFTIDLDRLFELKDIDKSILPAVALMPNNTGFEYFIDNKIIVFITGARERTYQP